MRSIVEGATTTAEASCRPLHCLRRSPSPASRVRNRGAALRGAFLPLALSVALIACSSAPSQPVTVMAVDAGRTQALVSAYRAQNGLGPVRVESRLMQAAAAQARAMGERDRIGHRVAGPLPRRVSAVGYDWGSATENLGAGYPSLDTAMQGWKDSADHRENLLNPNVTEIGVAAVRTPPGSEHHTYWALVLASPRPEPSQAGPFGMAEASEGGAVVTFGGATLPQ